MIETNYENLESWYGLRPVEKVDLGASVLQEKRSLAGVFAGGQYI